MRTAPRRPRVLTHDPMALSACAAHYAKAIYEPFHPDAMGACVPKLPARMSHKTHGTMRFAVTAGTNGYAFLSLSPCLANDAIFAVHSTATFNGTSSIGVIIGDTTGVATLNMSGLPYVRASLTDVSSPGNPAVSGRIVSVGVAIQYTGQNLTRGGVSRAYVDPNHSNLFGQNFAQDTAPGVTIQAVTERKHKYAISAIDTNEWEYQGGATTTTEKNAYPFSQGKTLTDLETATGGAPFYWDCTTTPGNTFFVDIIMHAEYVGRLASGNLTESHADSAGFEKVAAASAKVNAMRVSMPEAPLTGLFNKAMNEVIREITPAAVSGAKQAAGNFLRSYL